MVKTQKSSSDVMAAGTTVGPLNLPDTPYTSRRVLHGVRVEMAKRKKRREMIYICVLTL